MSAASLSLSAQPVLEVNDLRKHFAVAGGGPGRAAGLLRAVDGVSFSLARGETLSLVGESGCGKSTVAKTILRLLAPTSGQVVLAGRRIDDLTLSRLRPLRRRIQMVFQDPFSSLNPRMPVRDSIAEPIRNFRLARGRSDLEARLLRLMDRVGLPADALGRYPHEFSGGQRQRIGIARALAAEPDVIVCDEAVSALDVSVKAQIVNLLMDLQKDHGIALLFISHDLAVVEHMTHHVAVMYLGRIVETGSREALFETPRHPYTRALLSAVPVPEPAANRARIVLKGDVPSPIAPPAGCSFHTRCPSCIERCRTEEPPLTALPGGGAVACHLAGAEGAAHA
ncbi:ABC transporter ATP-binding protein [Azorhizobium doebereinerae]|uniref:ABC transporter ATP-binding protein n=1 Tax=Azorhizobium doebereinerae TaxID=281091 RepID=UPI00041F7169|nr:ABC transporter ATP-binding protein [Azorhizobium doebereinerae]